MSEKSYSGNLNVSPNHKIPFEKQGIIEIAIATLTEKILGNPLDKIFETFLADLLISP